MSRRIFNLIALAALAAAVSLGGCHSDSAGTEAAVPEATPVVRLVRQQGVQPLQFNASDVPGLSMVQVQMHCCRNRRRLRLGFICASTMCHPAFGPPRLSARFRLAEMHSYKTCDDRLAGRNGLCLDHSELLRGVQVGRHVLK